MAHMDRRMTIWAIADIHASFLDEHGTPSKPMEIFGDHWRDHVDRIEASWNGSVMPGDTVIVVGDTEWALRPEEAMQTLKRIDGWSGQKILVRGNHDYWWSSKATGRLRKMLPESIRLLHNNAFQTEGFNIVGCKGADASGQGEWTEEDAKLLNRELERLKLSLEARNPNLPSIAAMHYPPLGLGMETSPFTIALKDGGVDLCVYGHLHARSAHSAVEGEIDRIHYRLVAADYLGFRPVPVGTGGELIDHWRPVKR